MSAGQAVGGVVGAVAGFFVGGPAGAFKGAMYGMSIGGMLMPEKGPNIQGPRLNDLSQQLATYGAVIPRVYGSVALTGNIFWLENNQIKETRKKKKQGGKGGGGQTVTTYSYSATFAVGLCEGPVVSVRRVWISGELVYDAGAADIATLVLSNKTKFKIYTGSDTQLQDPRMQATLGVNCSAHRGLAYLVFDDFPLEKYGNTLMGAQIKVEVVKNGTITAFTKTVNILNSPIRYDSLYTPAVGRPYIISVESGLMVVGVVGSLATYLYTLDGVYIGTGLASYVPALSPQIFDTYFTYQSCGALEKGVYVWVLPGTSSIQDSRLHTPRIFKQIIGFPNASALDQNIPSNEKIIGVAISNDKQSIFIASTVTEGVAPGSWRVVDTSGNVIKSGPIATGVTSTSFGYSRGATSHYGSVAYDQDKNELALAYGAGNGWLMKFPVINGQPLTQMYEPTWNISKWNFSYPSIYVSGEIIYTVSEDSVCVFTENRLITSSVALSTIVSAECLKANLLPGDIDATALTDQVRGYRVAAVAAVRSSLDPLQGAFPFDAIQSGYKVKFKRRGVGSSVVTIDESMLDARSSGSTPGVKVTKSREMDSQMPWRVNLTHMDISREYDISEQYAERLNTDSVNLMTLEMPIVFTATEAAQKAETLLYMYWLDRYDISFTLPPQYGYLEPGDVISVTTSTANYQLRLVTLNYTSSGFIEVTAKFNDSAVYTSTATGADGWLPAQSIPANGPTRFDLLDIPLIDERYNLPGFPVAMSGYLSAWPGAVFFRSSDAGATWSGTADTTDPVTMGSTRTALQFPPDARMIDTSSVLVAEITSGALFSVTEQQMLSGENHFAVGDDGRWEIIAAKTCALSAGNVYVLTSLLRGRYGTEWAMGLHSPTDHIVLLDAQTLRWNDQTQSEINTAALYRAVTMGDEFDTGIDQSFTYTGVNLECLSPVYLNGDKSASTRDWTISWTRRSRIGGELRDYVDVPLGEETQAYEVEICTNNTYSSVTRTFTGLTTPTVVYTSAQQMADFGETKRILYVKVYQISATVGRGCPLKSSITSSFITPWDLTVLAMHMDGVNGSAVYTDIRGHVFARSGSAYISTTRSKFGGSSLLFTGSNSYLYTPSSQDFDFGSGDFTIDMWVYLDSVGVPNKLMSRGPTAGWGGACLYLYTTALGEFVFSASSDGSSWNMGATVSGVTAGAWHHLASVRNGNEWRAYLNGVSGAPTYSSAPITASVGRLFLGLDTASYGSMVGNIDDLRIIKGTALYTSNFTPPTSAFGVS